MSDSKKDKLTDHEYDGIQELDNDLPQWWRVLFYLTMVFAALYYAYYEQGNGPTLQEEFAQEVAAMEASSASAPQSLFPEPEKLASYAKTPEKVSFGRGVFQNRCLSCHGDKGQGGIGPNLTDAYWIHGDGTAAAIAKILRDGVPEKGMPPWGAILSEDDMYAVTTFVKTLKGSKPEGAKAPQGELVKE